MLLFRIKLHTLDYQLIIFYLKSVIKVNVIFNKWPIYLH